MMSSDCTGGTHRLLDDREEPADAATRELEKETGYRAGDVEYIGSFQPAPSMVDAERFMFLGTNPPGDAPTDGRAALGRLGGGA